MEEAVYSRNHIESHSIFIISGMFLDNARSFWRVAMCAWGPGAIQMQLSSVVQMIRRSVCCHIMLSVFPYFGTILPQKQCL